MIINQKIKPQKDHKVAVSKARKKRKQHKFSQIRFVK